MKIHTIRSNVIIPRPKYALIPWNLGILCMLQEVILVKKQKYLYHWVEVGVCHPIRESKTSQQIFWVSGIICERCDRQFDLQALKVSLSEVGGVRIVSWLCTQESLVFSKPSSHKVFNYFCNAIVGCCQGTPRTHSVTTLNPANKLSKPDRQGLFNHPTLNPLVIINPCTFFHLLVTIYSVIFLTPGQRICRALSISPKLQLTKSTTSWRMGFRLM